MNKPKCKKNMSKTGIDKGKSIQRTTRKVLREHPHFSASTSSYYNQYYIKNAYHTGQQERGQELL